MRYYHDMVGYNYRLEGIQGAVLSVSLQFLPEWTEKRRQIGRTYLARITNPLLTMQAHPENTDPVFICLRSRWRIRGTLFLIWRKRDRM